MEAREEVFTTEGGKGTLWKGKKGGGGYLQKNGEGREEVFTVEQGRDQERGVYSRTGKGEKRC